MNTILTELTAAAKAMRLSPAYLTLRAVGNAHLAKRLKDGAGVRPKTAKRLLKYLKAERKARGL